MQEFLLKNRESILIGGLVGAAAFLSLKLAKSNSKKHSKKEQNTKNMIEYVKKYSKLSFCQKPSLSDLAKTVQLIFENGFLQMETIKQIYETSYEFIREDFVILTFQNRKERRKFYYSYPEKYILLIIEVLSNYESLLVKWIDQFLPALNIDSNLFEKSLETLFKAGMMENLLIVQGEIRFRLKYLILFNIF